MKSCRPLKCQAWLITHARSLKNLTGQIFPPKSPSCRFRLALWKNGTLSLLVSDITYLGLDRMIPNGLHTCSRRSRGLEPERDTWRGTPHNLPFPSFFSIFLSFPFILFYFSFLFFLSTQTLYTALLAGQLSIDCRWRHIIIIIIFLLWF